jgi:hypothetical protein
MPESSINVEVAHKLNEKSEKLRTNSEEKTQHEYRIEIFEAFLLAIVAVASAWSGYQSARWDGHSAAGYAQASAYRVDADNSITLGGQERLHDISTFNTWLQAKTSGNEKMAELLERRFSGDFEPAFRAWLTTDPFNNPKAPPGPMFMPQYHNHLEKEGAELRGLTSEAFELGVSSREIGEDYVRLTVFLAIILFMVAIGQRSRGDLPHLILLSIAVISTCVILTLLIIYPRI